MAKEHQINLMTRRVPGKILDETLENALANWGNR
jgi:hypothetical protein